jgi:hypothetical protein
VAGDDGTSDTADDPDAAGRRLLDEARTGSLRERMRNHLGVNDPPEDVEAFRKSVESEAPLSNLVCEERGDQV